MEASTKEGTFRAFVAEILQDQSSLEANKKAKLASSVAKMFDSDQYVGTFTFLTEKIGITAFHCVYSPKEERIAQESLRLKFANYVAEVHHIVSFPHYDVSFYHLLGDLSAPAFLEVEEVACSLGDELLLVSFPSLEEGDCNTRSPFACYGHIEQGVSSIKNSFLLAKYECYPGSSGGAVLSKTTGRLVGIHIGSVFFEDTTYSVPSKLSPKQHEYPVTSGAVHSLQWSPPLADVDLEAPSGGSSSNKSSQSQEGEDISVDIGDALDAFAASLADVKKVACYAAMNAFQKGHHACFLPTSTLKVLVSSEPLFKSSLLRRFSMAKHGSKRKVHGKDADKKWRRQMRVIKRFIKRVKGLKGEQL